MLQFKRISQMETPKMEGQREVTKVLERELVLRFYESAPDAPSLLDVSPTALSDESDKIRFPVSKALSGSANRAPTNWIPLSVRPGTGPVEERTASSQIPFTNPPSTYLPCFVDFIARLLTSITASLFSIVPMILLSYLKPK